jgi:hypothetical protein
MAASVAGASCAIVEVVAGPASRAGCVADSASQARISSTLATEAPLRCPTNDVRLVINHLARATARDAAAPGQ